MSLIDINPYILFIILITLFSNISSTKKVMILEADQLDSQIKIASESNYKLFLLFYANNCQYCTMALKILKNQIVKNFEDEDEISFGSINLDEQKNIWLGLRFNVTKIPYAVLIENKRMYLFNYNFDEKAVINFINEEKNIEDALDIPEEMTFFWKLKSAMDELNENIEKILEKFGVNKTFGMKLAYILIILAIILFLYLENKLIDCCRNYFCNKRVNINEIKNEDEINKNNDKNEKEKKE